MRPLFEITGLFLKLGCIAFGGPAAHIALMEQEVVTRRKWMDHDQFLDLVAVTQLIPGPNSTEMVLHCGHQRGKLPGLLLAGIGFILPATAITLFFAWLYRNYGDLPQVAPVLAGIKPVVLAVIFWAMVRFGQKTLKARDGWIVSIATVLLVLLGLPEPIVLLGCGGLAIGLRRIPTARTRIPALTLAMSTVVAGSTVLPQLAWVFLKTGAILFGSGYVLIAFLEPELVTRLGWMTRPELVDAIAVGQLTPGPVLSTSAFIGYNIAGLKGGLLATLCIFAPSFIYVLLLTPWIPKMRNSPVTSAFLSGAKASAVALIAVVIVSLGTETLINPVTWSLFGISAVIMGKWPKLNVLWPMLAGAVTGVFLLS